MEPADPAPRQRVRGGVAAQEVPHEEVGAEFPRELQRKDPEAREPHARVIVNVARLGELARPRIERGDPRLARFRRGERFPTGGNRIDLRASLVDRREIIVPHRRPCFEPALPVRTPENFADELIGGRGRVGGEHRAEDLRFGDEAGANVRRESRDVLVMPRPEIEVPLGRVLAAGVRHERRQATERLVASRRPGGELGRGGGGHPGFVPVRGEPAPLAKGRRNGWLRGRLRLSGGSLNRRLPGL